MTTQQVIDKIFKDPAVKYELSEFEGLGISIHDMINIYSKNGTGKQTGAPWGTTNLFCCSHGTTLASPDNQDVFDATCRNRLLHGKNVGRNFRIILAVLLCSWILQEGCRK